jgi:hypothetical protein
MTIYLNMKTSEGVETVDQFTMGEDAPATYRDFRKYVSKMISEYNMAGMDVYKSQRCTNDWKNK